MHVISFSRLREFYTVHPTAKPGLLAWYKRAETTDWQTFVQLRETCPSADQVGKFIVFNIGGNNFRLITFIDFDRKKIFIRHVLTHADYDKDKWKDDPCFN
jgi:mRNA interferase HigB